MTNIRRIYGKRSAMGSRDDRTKVDGKDFLSAGIEMDNLNKTTRKERECVRPHGPRIYKTVSSKGNNIG